MSERGMISGQGIALIRRIRKWSEDLEKKLLPEGSGDPQLAKGALTGKASGYMSIAGSSGSRLQKETASAKIEKGRGLPEKAL